MITVMPESFEQMLPELLPILPIHYEELALNKDKVPLSPQYNIYIDRERDGQLLFMVMREAGEMIGYFIGFISPGLHYSTCLTCQMDIFYIRPDRRGHKYGKALFEAVEQENRRRGVQRWFVGSKCHLDASWLFEQLGFERVEVYYSKWLGE